MNQLRQTMMSETEITATKRRFGLFSQPPPIAIGDDSYFNSKTARKGEDGKPITKPRNMLAGSNRSGVSKKDFVTALSSIHAGDKYLDPEKIQHQFDLKYHTKATFHELEFKPASGHKNTASTPYTHIDQKPLEKKKPERDSDTGKVITKPRNVTVNPMKRVYSDFFKPLKHISDPYQRKDLFQSQERKISKSKMPQQVYRTMSHGNIHFTPDKRIYGQDQRVQELSKTKKTFRQSAPKVFNHETSFKLARRGHGDAIGKYPQFITPTETKGEIVKKIKKQKSQKEDWKPNGNKTLTRPTPSISYSSFSLRKYY